MTSNVFNAEEICENFKANTLPTLYGTPTYEYRMICLVIGLIAIGYFIIGFLLFLYFRNSFVRLQSRSILFTFCSMLSCIDLISITILGDYHGRDRIPCQLNVWLYHNGLILMAPGVVFTLYAYIYRLRKERERGVKVMRAWKQVKGGNGRSSETAIDHQSIKMSRQASIDTEVSESSMIIYTIIDFFHVMKHSKNGKIVINNGNNTNNAEEVKIEAVLAEENASATSSVNETESETSSQYGLFQFNDSAVGNYSRSWKQVIAEEIAIPLTVIVLLGMHVPISVAIRINVDPVYKAGCVGCFIGLTDILMNMFYVVTYALAITVAKYAMRNEQDPLGIFAEISMIMTVQNLGLVGWILQLVDPGQLVQQYKMNWHFLHLIALIGAYYALVYHQIIVSLLERRRVKQAFLKRDRATNTMAIQITSDEVPIIPDVASLDMNRILNEPKVRNALLEYSVDELSSENLAFVFKVRAWKAIWDKETPEKVIRIATNLYKEYVARDSKTPINIPNMVYLMAERALRKYLINQEGSNSGKVEQITTLGKPPITAFDDCEKECILIIETDTLPRFLKSELFKTRVIEAGLLRKIMRLD